MKVSRKELLAILNNRLNESSDDMLVKVFNMVMESCGELVEKDEGCQDFSIVTEDGVLAGPFTTESGDTIRNLKRVPGAYSTGHGYEAEMKRGEVWEKCYGAVGNWCWVGERGQADVGWWEFDKIFKENS